MLATVEEHPVSPYSREDSTLDLHIPPAMYRKIGVHNEQLRSKIRQERRYRRRTGDRTIEFSNNIEIMLDAIDNEITLGRGMARIYSSNRTVILRPTVEGFVWGYPFLQYLFREPEEALPKFSLIGRSLTHASDDGLMEDGWFDDMEVCKLNLKYLTMRTLSLKPGDHLDIREQFTHFRETEKPLPWGQEPYGFVLERRILE